MATNTSLRITALLITMRLVQVTGSSSTRDAFKRLLSVVRTIDKCLKTSVTEIRQTFVLQERAVLSRALSPSCYARRQGNFEIQVKMITDLRGGTNWAHRGTTYCSTGFAVRADREIPHVLP